jgi:cell division protein FtsL
MKLGTAVFVVLMVTVWEHVTAVRLETELKSLRKEHDRLTYETGRMQAQINHWTAPSNLDAIARKDFKMIPLDSQHVIGISKP